MRRLALFSLLIAGCGTYRFQHGPDDHDELVTCPPCALPEVCDESRHVCSVAQLVWEELDGSGSGDGLSGAGATDVALTVSADGSKRPVSASTATC
jgi:hypothetical protein